MTSHVAHRCLFLLLVVSLTAFSGCAFFANLVGTEAMRPKLELQGIEVTKVSFDTVHLAVNLQVTNPNRFEIALNALQYQVDAAQLILAQGVYEEPFKVPGQGRNKIRLPVVVNSSSVMTLAKRLLQTKEELKATLRAKVTFQTPVGAMDVVFREEQSIMRL